MYRYFFNQEIREKYYNCSGRTYEEWAALGHPNLGIGITYIVLGVVFFVTYFPFMVVFVKSDLLKHSCYKIMFYLGIIDMLQIPVGACVGYFSLVGMVFCMAPDLNYVFGGLALGLWIAGSSTCMLLSFNRCIDLIDHNLATTLFDGRRTYFWLLLPTVYGGYFWIFYSNCVFSSVIYAFVFDPYVGMPERHGTIDLEHYPYAQLSAHNLLVAVWLVVAYGGLCIKLSLRSRGLSGVPVSRVQRQAFITALLICTGTFVCATIYCFLMFMPLPVWVAFIGEMGWQFSHGMVGLTYLLMNPTMRREALRIFFNQKGASVFSPTTLDQRKTATDSAAVH